MTWTTELPTAPGWYYRRAVSADGNTECDIVSIFSRQWSHEPIALYVERFWEEGAEPVSGYVTGVMGGTFQYEFQPVKLPEET